MSSEDHVSPLSFFWRNKRERMMEQKNKRRRKKAEKTLQKKVKKNDKKRTTLFPMLERVCMFSVGSPPPLESNPEERRLFCIECFYEYGMHDGGVRMYQSTSC